MKSRGRLCIDGKDGRALCVISALRLERDTFEMKLHFPTRTERILSQRSQNGIPKSTINPPNPYPHISTTPLPPISTHPTTPSSQGSTTNLPPPPIPLLNAPSIPPNPPPTFSTLPPLINPLSNPSTTHLSTTHLINSSFPSSYKLSEYGSNTRSTPSGNCSLPGCVVYNLPPPCAARTAPVMARVEGTDIKSTTRS